MFLCLITCTIFCYFVQKCVPLHRYPEYNLFTLNETNTKRNAFAVKRGRFAFYTRFIFYYFLRNVSFLIMIEPSSVSSVACS